MSWGRNPSALRSYQLDRYLLVCWVVQFEQQDGLSFAGLMQPEARRERLAPTSEERAAPALTISSILKYKADKACGVCVEMAELGRRD
ncbi:MAG: hypothetical protein WBC04_04720 [Candidatus Acidiferrales bacterium]